MVCIFKLSSYLDGPELRGVTTNSCPNLMGKSNGENCQTLEAVAR